MNKRVRVNSRPVFIQQRRISQAAFTAISDPCAFDSLHPVFSFQHASEESFPLAAWQPQELTILVQALREYSSRPWHEVKRLNGFSSIHPNRLIRDIPETISPDETIYECCISDSARLFGFRSHHVFHVFWFDRNRAAYKSS